MLQAFALRPEIVWRLGGVELQGHFDLNTISNVDLVTHLGFDPFTEPYTYQALTFITVLVIWAAKNSYSKVKAYFWNRVLWPAFISHFIF